MDLISLLVMLIVIGLAFWAVHTLSGTFGIPSQFVVVLQVILVIVFVVWVLKWAGMGGRLGFS